MENIAELKNANQWLNLDESLLAYHKNQWDHPKFSTIAFEKFISRHLATSKNVIDLGAGSGAPTAFLAEKYKSVNFLALDYSKELVELGKTYIIERNLKNLDFDQGDIFELNSFSKFDGCTSMQTLSWLTSYQSALESIFSSINPNWIALTSLFYEGNISCKIEVTEHLRQKTQHYNVYSIPEVNNYCKKYGYQITEFEPFKIEVDLAKPTDLDFMSTYTRKLFTDNNNNSERIQISGPLLMNWYMVLIEKEHL